MPPFPYKKLRNESSRQVVRQCAAEFLRETSQNESRRSKGKAHVLTLSSVEALKKVKAVCRDDLTQKERHLVRQACDFSKNGFEPMLLQAVCKNSRALTRVHSSSITGGSNPTPQKRVRVCGIANPLP